MKTGVLLEAIHDALILGCTVSLKSEGYNTMSIRVSKKVDETTIKHFDSALPYDTQHALNDVRVAAAINYGKNKIV